MNCYDLVSDKSQKYARTRDPGTAQWTPGPDLTEQDTSHVTLISLISTLSELITLITVTTVRISLVYRNTRSLLCSCVQLIVHSDCLVYNNTKPLLQYFITATCPLHRVQTRPLSHLTSHSRDGSHLGQGPNSRHDIRQAHRRSNYECRGTSMLIQSPYDLKETKIQSYECRPAQLLVVQF